MWIGCTDDALIIPSIPTQPGFSLNAPSKFSLKKGDPGGLGLLFFSFFFFSSINYVPVFRIETLLYQLFPILCQNL
jgi:hypothetical protein